MKTNPWHSIDDKAVRRFAYDAVVSMGDIFFDPRPDFGELSIPENIAQNQVARHMRYMLQAMNIIVTGTLEDLPECREVEA